MIIALEGIDGSGKTYAAKFLYRKLKASGYKVKLVLSKQLINKRKKYLRGFINLNIPDVKALVYLSQAITVWEDMVKWEKENPEGILIKDRSWLTVLVYTALGSYKYASAGLLSGLTHYIMKKMKSPEMTHVFLPEYDKKRVAHRKNLKKYYSCFPGGMINLEYSRCLNILRNFLTFTVHTESTIESFDIRNNKILGLIKQQYKNVWRNRKGG